MAKVFVEILADRVDEWERKWKDIGVIENDCGKMIIRIGNNKEKKRNLNPKINLLKMILKEK